ncbi:hypothetical protein RHSIM_Rhsim06G0107700 [Rhododendron simsii]|uniref:Uncharacterized protein n=1 Tax=Rhododendron simsii TaxID=118357 RepID=A0A834GTX6_RHOSS|nr:hypothetical protein RHSIM_Rhsim06G0107700 [Rhododendron simsii]
MNGVFNLTKKIKGGGNVGNVLTCAARLGLNPRLISKHNKPAGCGKLDEVVVCFVSNFLDLFTLYPSLSPSGKHTWKNGKFSQINKRELHSNAVEVGGYKWWDGKCGDLGSYHGCSLGPFCWTFMGLPFGYSVKYNAVWDVVIHCIDSGRKSMIEVEKSLWTYLKCWMGLLMLILIIKAQVQIISGLTTLEGQVKSKNGRGKLEDVKDSPVPIVRIDEDTFILVDDVLLLLERAVLEPLPPKDDNRMKLVPVSRLLLWKVLLIRDVFGGEDKGQKDIWCWISKCCDCGGGILCSFCD